MVNEWCKVENTSQCIGKVKYKGKENLYIILFFCRCSFKVFLVSLLTKPHNNGLHFSLRGNTIPVSAKVNLNLLLLTKKGIAHLSTPFPNGFDLPQYVDDILLVSPNRKSFNQQVKKSRPVPVSIMSFFPLETNSGQIWSLKTNNPSAA